uniref:Holin n=1 Tax=Siphoviridae sp. ctPUt3 TaxID=2825485 RepID=A0A8S5U4Q6_9CAUD|nr:MAG TPA: holin [Siphoviridae sp. ctPUt3]
MSILLTVPAIVALTNLAKRTGLPAKLAPLVSVLAGVAVACGDAYSTGAGYLDAAARGIILGLTASGLYDLMPGEPKGSTVNVYGKDSVRGRHSATTGTPEPDPIEPDAPAKTPTPAPEPQLDPAAAAAAHVASLPAPATAPTELHEALRKE